MKEKRRGGDRKGAGGENSSDRGRGRRDSGYSTGDGDEWRGRGIG